MSQIYLLPAVLSGLTFEHPGEQSRAAPWLHGIGDDLVGHERGWGAFRGSRCYFPELEISVQISGNTGVGTETEPCRFSSRDVQTPVVPKWGQSLRYHWKRRIHR